MATKQIQFEALVRAYAADLYRFAFWLCRNSDYAEDLVQETFARAWRSLADLHDHKAVKSWLLTILRREHARLYGKQQRQSDALNTFNIEQLGGLGDGATATEDFAIRRALAGLPLSYREPLLLQVLGGYRCAEIGEMLGISEAAVLTRLFRARKWLQQTLAGDQTDIHSGAV